MYNSIDLILKLTERCNLNCKYCYYFNGLDQSYKEKPAAIKPDTIDKLINFLLVGINELSLTSIGIVFHGGEPLLLNKNLFIEYCSKITSFLSPRIHKLDLSIQSNGVLIDEEWIKIFKKYNVRIGISTDGTQEYHDEHRVDHKGKGSYNKISKSIKLLQDHECDFGILSVIDPSKDPEIIFNHFIKDLRINGLDFLWPDFTHDYLPPYPAEEYGIFIAKILKLWLENDDPSISIRFINSYIKMFLGKQGIIYGEGANSTSGHPIFVVRSDGEISPSDELMATGSDRIMKTSCNISNTSLKKFFNLPIFYEIDYATHKAPEECSKCCWETVCGGGRITNRFSKQNNFNNKSIYCEGLKIFFSAILQGLVSSGISVQEIAKNLCIKNYNLA